MTQKFFFFDIDNTLIPWPSGRIADSTAYALQELCKNGHRIAIATGRLQIDALRFADQAGIRDYVADGGFSVTINRKLHWMQSLDLKACTYVLDQLEEAQIPWAITLENKTERLTHFPDLRPQKAPWDHFETRYVPHIDYKNVEQIYKIYIYASPKEESHHTIDYGTLETIRYRNESVLIEPMDKALGIRMLADYYKVPYEHIVTFGDGKNDLRMFDPTWTNIAMGNARTLLKEKATYVTSDCTSDGILEACQYFGWVK